jgi:hypothetical protein
VVVVQATGESNMSPRPPAATHAERVVSLDVQLAIRERLRNGGACEQTSTACFLTMRKATNDEAIDSLREGRTKSSSKLGVACDVVAATRIPVKAGDRATSVSRPSTIDSRRCHRHR